jgi:hypothetical protein
MRESILAKAAWKPSAAGVGVASAAGVGVAAKGHCASQRSLHSTGLRVLNWDHRAACERDGAWLFVLALAFLTIGSPRQAVPAVAAVRRESC